MADSKCEICKAVYHRYGCPNIYDVFHFLAAGFGIKTSEVADMNIEAQTALMKATGRWIAGISSVNQLKKEIDEAMNLIYPPCPVNAKVDYIVDQVGAHDYKKDHAKEWIRGNLNELVNLTRACPKKIFIEPQWCCAIHRIEEETKVSENCQALVDSFIADFWHTTTSLGTDFSIKLHFAQRLVEIYHAGVHSK